MKRFLLFLSVILPLFIFTACGIPENDPDIIADVSERYASIFEGVKLTGYEVIKRNTEETTDIIYVSVTDTLTEHEVCLLYNYVKDKGWVLNPQGCTITIPENTPDLSSDLSDVSLPLCEKATIVSVEKLESKRSVNISTVTAEVKCKAESADCIIQLELIYKYHAKKGWQPESVMPANSSSWSAFPIKGLPESKINSLKTSLRDNGYGEVGSFDSVSLSHTDTDLNSGIQEVSFNAEGTSGIKGISGLFTYRYNFNYNVNGNILTWGWDLSSDSPFVSLSESYDNWEGKWYIDSSASRQSGEYIIAISGKDIKVLSPNGYTSYGTIDTNGAYISMRYSNVIDDTNTRITFCSDGTIDYSEDGFMGRRYTQKMYRTPSYGVVHADERFRNNFGY